MKTIVVKWIKENIEEFGIESGMYVVESSHEYFSKGTRFDFGLFKLATEKGFTIISIPQDIDIKITTIWKQKKHIFQFPVMNFN